MNNDVNFTVISPNFLNLQKDCLFKLGPNYFWYVIKEWKPIGPLRTNLASSIGRDRTVQLFGTTGQKFLHCPGTKGQWDKLTILPRDGPGQLKSGMGRARTAKIRDGTRDKIGQSRKGCSKTGNGCSKTGKDVLKQENDVLKQEIWSFSYFGTSFSCFFCSFGKAILSRDIPGH